MKISKRLARETMVGLMGLRQMEPATGAEGVRAMLASRRCVQLDPLAPMGTNADLVTMARVVGAGRGDVHRHLHPGHAFEHFAKERCILPAEAFPYYRDQLAETPWWRLTERLKRLPESLLDEVLAEVGERGPVTSSDLEARGRVKPLDWSGWLGTSKASTMALEVLWTRCQIVVCGRTSRGKLYDLPSRALPHVWDKPSGDFGRWALLDRVKAAGLLARASGPHWSMLSDVRTSELPDQLIEEGLLMEVRVEGSRRPYLTATDTFERTFPEDDGQMRILGPLDPLIWDRKLTRQIFGFEYVWEVYKKKEKRRWGWYVCPLLHNGQLVGRIDARVKDGELVVDRVWDEVEGGMDQDAFQSALEQHAEACGAEGVVVKGV